MDTEMEVDLERETETERKGRKRVRGTGAAAAPSSQREDPATPAAQEWLARLVAESIKAWERRTAEEKGKPEVDDYALKASQFPELWNSLWSGYFGSFDDTTKIEPSRFTDEPPPPHTAFACRTLQIFSVRVGGIRDGLQWPLQVFVALRDSIDHNRNIIFQHTRDNCQTLTEKDACLALTGPVHAVASLDYVTFEVKLTVKGTTGSDDKDLSALAVPLSYDPDSLRLYNMDYTSKLSTIVVTYGHLRSSVEASIGVLVSSGASLGRVQCVASTASIDKEKVILLDSADGEVSFASDGTIKLSRHVVSVEVNEKLKVSVSAWRQGDNKAIERSKEFTAKKADRSHGMLNFGFCRMKVTVAWSLISVYG